NIAMTQNQIAIFTNAGKLLQDNYKNTQSRVTNGKVLKGNALRILSDINANEAKLAEAQNNLKTAKAYFNFLINERLDKEVAIDTTSFRQADKNITDLATASEREEIASLRSALQQAHLTTRQRSAAYLPKISAFLDGGYQSTYFKINPDTSFLLGGFSLKWTLFNGFQNKNKIAFAKKEEALLEAKIDQSLQQFEYQKNTSQNDLATAEVQLKSSAENLTYLEEYYRETKSRYDQGMVLLVELNDAFTQLINGRLNFELSNTTVLIKKAEVERVSASYQF
ncbi:MAG: TolC family protein, partial [Sphingobacteriales bacterium]